MLQWNRALTIAALFAGLVASPLSLGNPPADKRCEESSGWNGETLCRVPMTAVTASPEQYDGYLVWVTGIANLSPAEREYVAIYQSREGREILDDVQSILVPYAEVKKTVADPASLDGKLITVVGRFKALMRPLGSQAAGTLLESRGVQVRVDPRNPPRPHPNAKPAKPESSRVDG